jgi:hypothetical protein
MKKICKKCEKEKSIDEFNNFKHSKDGKSPYCRVCKCEIDSYSSNNETLLWDNATFDFVELISCEEDIIKNIIE